MATQRIGRYGLGRPLGKGALATVYLGRDDKLERDVAIKVLTASPEHKELRRRFQLEARAIATLKHPNIVQLFDYSDDDSPELFLVMEYVPGRSVAAFLDERGPLSEITALSIGHEIALALAHAHAHAVVHRDVKPSNVVLHDGRVVLIDFGGIKVFESTGALGKEYNDSQTRAVGTPGFMAPEQFEGRDIEPRTDLFALGALLYNITTDALPYQGSDVDQFYEAVASGKYRDPRDYQPLLTPAFCSLLGDCMRVKASERVASAAELVARISELLVAHGVSDIRAELRAYEAEGGALPQASRSVQTLLRDLKLALFRELQAAVRDKDGRGVQSVIRRMQQIAPIDEEGLPKKLRRRQQLLRGTGLRRAPWWFVAGLVAGLGAAAVVVRLTLLGDAATLVQWLCERDFVGFGWLLP